MILSTLTNNKVVKTKVSHVNFDITTEVLVVGAGSAGVYVCDSASREGAKVTLIEQSSILGGMHVKGNVTSFYMGSDGGTFEKDVDKNDSDTVFYSSESNWEQKHIRVCERLQNSGATILTETVIVGIYFDGSIAVGVKAFNGKFINVKSQIIVDATSDGHLIRMTDVNKRYGRDFDGATAPFTIRRQYLKGDLFITNNGDSGHVNQYDEFDFSNKIISARASAKKYFKDSKFISLASYAGIREGLTFEGEEVLTYKEFVLRRETDRTLFYIYSDLDKHGYDRAVDIEGFQDWWVISNLPTVAVNAPIPMGAVVPKGLKGIITAGRCLSADCYTQGAVRMNKDMFRMGECIGVATAMAVKSNVDFLKIDYDRYLARVKELGCFKGKQDRDYAFQTNKAWYDNKMNMINKPIEEKYKNLEPSAEIYFPVEFDLFKTYNLLKTEEPGVAFWSCYIYKNRENLCNYLYDEMLLAEDKLYKYNLAIALGLLKDKRSLLALKEIILNRDCFYYKDNRRSNQFRSVLAVCLLGRFGSVSDLSILDDVLAYSEIENKMYHTLEPNYLFHPHNDRNFLYFQMVTHTIMAYIKICKREGDKSYLKYLNKERADWYVKTILDGKVNQQAKEEVENFFINVCNKK